MKKMLFLLKRPSAWLPIALSFVALMAMLLAIALSGPPVRQADEGVGAHLFQIWLLLEAGMVVFFGFVWLPRKPKEAMIILAIQIMLVLAGCAPVAYFHL